MDIGLLLLIFAFALSLIAAYFYFQAARGESQLLKIARIIYKFNTVLLFIVSGYLLYLLLSHQFNYDYVYRYSSRSLPLGYLISSFWAGQEGSYLLWVLYIGVLGILFMRGIGKCESYSMIVVSLAKSFLILLMIDKSPFELLPVTPPDGAGLNPLLQDPWMVVHPPILFIGYASSTFPFALSIAAILTNDYVNWIKHALRWSLIVSITLGAGIIIGGFWAYEVLGWGGYWGWDPVENSSLIPWLVTLALFHGILIQKMKNSLVRFNLFLSILAFVLVIYATFLTRSGVLANFSVHSFAGEGQNHLLIGFMLITLVVSLFLFFKNFEKVQTNSFDPFKLNRESGLFWSMVVLLLSGLFTFIGTSSPIITGIFSSSPTPVETTFYNRVNFPLGILILLLLGITPLLLWGNSKMESFVKYFSISVAFALGSTAFAYVLGVREIKILIFITASTFAIVSNFLMLLSHLKVNIINIGGPLAHFGVALMFLGIIVSGNFDRTERALLELHKPSRIGEYQLIYHGISNSKSGKTEIKIEMQKDGKSINKKPKLYFSSYNNAWMREPDITIFPLYDLYISVMERQESFDTDENRLVLKKGDTQEFENYELTFQNFEFENHGMGEDIRIAANINVKYKGKDYIIKPAMLYQKNQKISDPVDLPSESAKKSVALSDINADEKMIALIFYGFNDAGSKVRDKVLIEFTVKPFMNFVWFGAIILILGSVIAYVRRVIENKTNNGNYGRTNLNS